MGAGTIFLLVIVLVLVVAGAFLFTGLGTWFTGGRARSSADNARDPQNRPRHTVIDEDGEAHPAD